MHRRVFLGTAFATAFGVAGIGGAISASSGGEPEQEQEPTAETETSSSDFDGVGNVERRTLFEEQEFNATVSYGDAFDLPVGATGTVTSTRGAGTIIEPGDEILRIDNSPVFLAEGVVPMYRTLKRTPDVRVQGQRYMMGYDVAHLKTFLAAAGFDDDGNMQLDGVFDPATERAVKAWQKAVGFRVTGRVDNTQLVIHPAAVRVDTSPQFGAAFSSLSVTAVEQRVGFDVANRDRRLVTVGGTVEVAAPSGETVPGTITAVERTVNAEGASNVRATVVPDSPLPADATAAVVTSTDTLAEDVLAVPVRALLAVAQGGLAIELTSGRLIPVEVGAVADGWAEVDSDVAEGDEVVMAQ